MIAAIADTHAVIWYITPDPRLSATAKTFIDNATEQGIKVGVSSITVVEIIYLVEKNKIPSESMSKLAAVFSDTLGAFIEIPLNLPVARSVSEIDRNQIPDMPDPIIAATALHHNVPLISREGRIRASGIHTIW